MNILYSTIVQCAAIALELCIGVWLCPVCVIIGQSGKWSTSEGSVLSIGEDSGVAVASATGRAVVYHKIGGVVDTLTEVRHVCV